MPEHDQGNDGMEDLAKTIMICLALVVGLGGFIGGCTYVVSENNRLYYDTMRQCIDGGGSFVPTRGDGSSAVCLHR